MKFKLISLSIALVLFSACSKDDNTPEEHKASSYLKKTLNISGEKTLSCDESKVVLPKIEQETQLGDYIIEIHQANKESDFSRLSVESMQKVFRKCIRPELVKRYM